MGRTANSVTVIKDSRISLNYRTSTLLWGGWYGRPSTRANCCYDGLRGRDWLVGVGGRRERISFAVMLGAILIMLMVGLVVTGRSELEH
jgi:hypothetical protein